MKKIAYHTLGCKVNQYETEAMQQQFEDKGYETVHFDEIADVYIINTCTVTNIADRKSRQMLHRAKKVNPNSIVVAVGCYVQAAKEALLEDEYIDLVIGNNKKHEIVNIVEATVNGQENIDTVLDIGKEKDYEELFINKVTEKTRAYIKIQDGCNQFCSYCIIPYARGRVRSRNEESILVEVENLSKQGYKEVVLTGIHLASYGIDLEDNSLLKIMQKINSIQGIERIRLGSLEPTIITEDFIKEIVKLEKLCPHFHLSLQSGSDATLKRMNRKYSTDDFRKAVANIRKGYVNPAITTDIIVGFPQESEEEFEQTYKFVEEIAFADVHVFKYSRRNGTVADKMEGQVADKIKSSRSEKLIKLGKVMTDNYKNLFIGTTQKVLFEEKININGIECQVGYTDRYIKISLIAKESLENNVLGVKIDRTNLIY
ncbi:MAG: MiaB-like tRNA modifying enzyme [Clostridiales bacterium]|jgi:threonylcarbamoyladenosine tRNA methylthiotransferase MtaB|nr:MiaB-like tRNA modifying enzyme [Clostridiales bacterium]